MQRMRNGSWVLVGFLHSQELRIWLRLLRRPLMIVAALFVMLCLGAWLDAQLGNHVAQAQSQVFACRPGTVESSGLCFPPCQQGFESAGSLCLAPCPSGYTLRGGVCLADVLLIFKETRPHPIGQAPICPANQEFGDGLCYPQCPAGYEGNRSVCMEICREDEADEGSSCSRRFDNTKPRPKDVIGRGDGVAPLGCPSGTDYNGFTCVAPCPTGFVVLQGSGCVTQCPTGFNDEGNLCRRIFPTLLRTFYIRGAGEPKNGLPIAQDASFAGAANRAVSLVYRILDDTTPTNYPIQLVQTPKQGVLENNNTVYRPNPGVVTGTDRILWKTNDGKHESNVGVITIVIGQPPANTPPVALDRTVVVTEETPIMLDVLCTDTEQDELFYQLLAKPQHGEYEWVAPNTVIYTPTVDFVGTDSITFRSHDGQDFSNVSTITLTVGGVNDAPLAQGQTISTTRNHNAALLLAATDAEGDAISYSLVASPTYGTLSGTIPDLLYTPQLHFVGDDNFQFRASDDQGAASVATINLTVLPTNTAPVAESLILTGGQENLLAINLSASDVDNDVLTYTLVTSPTHGELRGSGADWVYRPVAGFTGSDSFTYQSHDGQADSLPTTVTIHVTPTAAEGIVVGFVYDDHNGNGQFDESEQGVSGLLATLIPITATSITAGAGEEFTTFTDVFGGWQFKKVPFGNYTVRISAASGVSLEQTVETPLTVARRGVQALQTTVVKVTGRPVFLPMVMR